MSRYPSCLDCPAPVKLRDRDRCHVCHRRVERAALKRPCSRCGETRHLTAEAICATCTRGNLPRRPPKLTVCSRCGQQQRNAGHGLCGRCVLADPDRPFRYSAALARRLSIVPPWWEAFTGFVAARHHPSGAVQILRTLGAVLAADASPKSPQQLQILVADHQGAPGALSRALTSFFTQAGLSLPPDDARRRAQKRRQRLLDAIPASFVPPVAAFTQTLVSGRDRARRIGARPISDITLESKLRILRDLANHLSRVRRLTSWVEVTTADLDSMLAVTPKARHHQTYVLRQFFAWAKGQRLLLIDPAKPLRVGPQPGFVGAVLERTQQRALLRRWTRDDTHPHERFIGLLALLHAASNQEIRALTVRDVNRTDHTLTLGQRPFPTPIDPTTWAAVEACLDYRDTMRTLNPHLLVTAVTRTRSRPADGSYLSRALAAAGTTPSACRQTRVGQLVIDLDPKLTAAVLGMHDSGLVRYLADNVAHDRLTKTTRTSSTRAFQVTPRTP